MAIPENDNQLWGGFNDHGLYAKRAERDKNGNPIDTTYATKDPMVGATSQEAGEAGLVPAPAVADKDKFLKGDGTWATIEIGEQKVHVLNKTAGLTTTEFEQAWEWLENGHLVGAWYNDRGFKYLFIADKYYTYQSSQTEYYIIFSYIRYATPLENQYEGVNRDTLTWVKSGVGNMTWGTKPIMPSPLNQFGRYLYTNGQGGVPYWKEIKEVPASIASDAGKVLTVNAQGSAAWSTVTPYATEPSANNVLLLGDATGGKTWTALENDVFGTQLLDENDQPILDETTREPIYDAYSTGQLWTGFAGKGFGAIRAYADQDGHNIVATYVKKAELNEPDEAPESDIDHMFSPYGLVEIGGRSYRTITIGNQEWLADNLDYTFECDGEPLPINPEEPQTTPAAWYYNRESDYGIDGTYKCGLLYNWYAAHYLKEHEDTLLPAGWQVASDVQWETLLRYIVDPISTATYPCSAGMKAADGSIADNWPDGWNGTNEYNFNIVPGGQLHYGTFSGLGSTVNEWAINRVNDLVRMISFTKASDNVSYIGPSSETADEFRKNGYYVRLVKPLA